MFWRRRVQSSFDSPITLKIKLEIHVATTAEAQAIVTAIEALPGQFAAASSGLQSELDAATAALASEKQDHTDDLTAIQGAVTAVTPAAAS